MVRRSERRTERRSAGGGMRQLPWQAVTNPYPPFEILSADQIESIHVASMRILEEMGVEVMSDEARRLLRRAGAEVDEARQLVRFHRHLVTELVSRAPDRVI